MFSFGCRECFLSVATLYCYVLPSPDSGRYIFCSISEDKYNIYLGTVYSDVLGLPGSPSHVNCQRHSCFLEEWHADAELELVYRLADSYVKDPKCCERRKSRVLSGSVSSYSRSEPPRRGIVVPSLRRLMLCRGYFLLVCEPLPSLTVVWFVVF